MPARICIVRHSYYPQDSHVQRDAETLRGMGFEVDVICLKARDEKRRETLAGVNVHRIPIGHKRGGMFRYVFEYAAFFACAKALLTTLHIKKRFDFIEVDTMPDFLVFAALPAKLMGAKVVIYMFENMPELMAYEHRLGMDHRIIKVLRFIEKISLKFADRVVATHIPARDLFMRHGIPEEKFTIVLNVPNPRVFAGPQESLEAGDGSFLIVSHGSMLHRYGYQTVVGAMKLLEDRIPRMRGLLIGDGEYRGEICRLAEELGVSDRTEIPGWVPFAELPPMLAQADIGIVPMLADLMLPNKLFEYVGAEIPVIVTALPTMKAYFDDTCVTYFEPGDEEDLARAILHLFENPEERRAKASRALELFRSRYHWDVMKNNYVGIYRQ